MSYRHFSAIIKLLKFVNKCISKQCNYYYFILFDYKLYNCCSNMFILNRLIAFIGDFQSLFVGIENLKTRIFG